MLVLPFSASAQNVVPQGPNSPPVVEGKALFWSIDDVKKALSTGAPIPLPRTPTYFIAAANRTQGKPQAPEAHTDRAQFYVVLGGSGIVMVGGDVPNHTQTAPVERRGPAGQPIVGGTAYRVKTGDMLLIPRNTWHNAQPDQDGLMYVLVNLIQP
jgi:mannose-6-phosphate isomerase-like protein (cupin superfamily)